MPPTVTAIAPPVGRTDARAFLESRGIIARVPTIRSRDFGLVNTCRFLYYLTRRLSLSSPFKPSDALRHGSWFHTRFEAIGLEGPRLAAFMAARLKAREQELREVCKGLDIGVESTAEIVASEKEDSLTTWAWFEAAAQFRRADIPELRLGFEHYFANLPGRVLAKEVRLCLNHRAKYSTGYKNVMLVAQLDELRYNEKTNTLWIPDLKSTASAPIERAATLPCEFQPRHFSYVLQQLILEGVIQRHFKLPSDVKFGGFIHLIVQKPAIRMNQKDRPYIYESQGVKKKMKGRAVKAPGGGWLVGACDIDRPDWPAPSGIPLATDQQAIDWLQSTCGKLPEKVYSGEPQLHLYKARCVEWYNGTGEYEADRPKRESTECPVNISIMPASSLLDRDNVEEYLTQLQRVCDYALRPAEPSDFDRTSAGMEHDDYAPFYTAPPALWPALIMEKRLLQQPWDEDVTSLPEPTHRILESTR